MTTGVARERGPAEFACGSLLATHGMSFLCYDNAGNERDKPNKRGDHHHGDRPERSRIHGANLTIPNAPPEAATVIANLSVHLRQSVDDPNRLDAEKDDPTDGGDKVFRFLEPLIGVVENAAFLVG